MQAILINGSPRKNGNTKGLLKITAQVLEEQGINTEIVNIGGEVIRGCTACRKCGQLKNNKCVINDALTPVIEKMLKADAIIIGSPTYFADLTPELKALIDRCGVVARANDMALSKKIGAAVAVARRAGALNTFDSINHFYLMSDMIVPGSTYWNVSKAAAIDDYQKDEEAQRTVSKLAQNIAWLLKKIHE